VLAYAAARVPAVAGIVLGAGAFGAALHVLVLWRGIEELLPWSLIVLGIGYTISLLVHGGPVDGAAPLVAVALLVAAELAVWSLEERYPVPAELRIFASRVWALSALAVGGLLAAGLVVALSASTAGAGLAWTALGTVAAVLVVAIATRLVRRAA
jgi:hypothetical protein